MAAKGGGGPGVETAGRDGATPDANPDVSFVGESAELKGALDRARRAAEEELSAVKSELEESRAAAAASEENLRSLSEAYNGLEAEVFRHEEESRGLRARLEAFEKNAGASAPVAAPPAADAGGGEGGGSPRGCGSDGSAIGRDGDGGGGGRRSRPSRRDGTSASARGGAGGRSACGDGRDGVEDRSVCRRRRRLRTRRSSATFWCASGKRRAKRTRSTRDWWRNTARARLNSTRCWNRASRTTTKKTRERGAPPSARRKRQSRAPS